MEHNMRIIAFPDTMDPFIITPSAVVHDKELAMFRDAEKDTYRFKVQCNNKNVMHLVLQDVDASSVLQVCGDDIVFCQLTEVINTMAKCTSKALEVVIEPDDYKMLKFMETHVYTSVSIDKETGLIFYRM